MKGMGRGRYAQPKASKPQAAVQESTARKARRVYFYLQVLDPNTFTLNPEALNGQPLNKTKTVELSSPEQPKTQNPKKAPKAIHTRTKTQTPCKTNSQVLNPKLLLETITINNALRLASNSSRTCVLERKPRRYVEGDRANLSVCFGFWAWDSLNCTRKDTNFQPNCADMSRRPSSHCDHIPEIGSSWRGIPETTHSIHRPARGKHRGYRLENNFFHLSRMHRLC